MKQTLIVRSNGRSFPWIGGEVGGTAIACTSCNKYKGSDLASIDPLNGAIGRVTVRLLQLNRSTRVSVRRVLAEAEVWQAPMRMKNSECRM